MTDNYVVERSKTIDAAPEAVFEKVIDLREWDTWSPWAELDPDMDTTFSGEQGEIGAGYAWKGNRKVGEGSMRVTDVDSPSRIEIDLRFLKPFKSESVTEWLIEPNGDGSSQVTWRMTGENTLMTRIMGIFKSMDSMVGPDFEKGLTKLKRQLET